MLKTLLKQGHNKNGHISSSNNLAKKQVSASLTSTILKRQNFTPVPTVSKKYGSPSRGLNQNLNQLEKQCSGYNPSPMLSKKLHKREVLTPSSSQIRKWPIMTDSRQVEETLALMQSTEKQREETMTTDEHFFENDFSLPDEIHYQMLQVCE